MINNIITDTNMKVTKEWIKKHKGILEITICLSITLFLFLMSFVPNLRGFIFERGEVTGQFISVYHRGYGDECGQYPMTEISMLDVSPVPTVVKDFMWHDDGTPTNFYFGNDFLGVDNLVGGVYYKIHYHREYRASDASSGSLIPYWVIDSIEKVEG